MTATSSTPTTRRSTPSASARSSWSRPPARPASAWSRPGSCRNTSTRQRASSARRPPPRVKVEALARLTVVQVDPPLILAAIDLHRLHRLSTWDALILQAAAAGGCRELLSEDMQTGFRHGGVAVVNPFG